MKETLYVEDESIMSDDEEYALYLRAAFRAFHDWCNDQPVGAIIRLQRYGQPNGLMFMTSDGPRWFWDDAIIAWLCDNEYEVLAPEHKVADLTAIILIHPADREGVLFKLRWLG